MAVRIHGTFGSWVLPGGMSVLGRGSGCDVRIDDPRLSRNHARFTVEGRQLLVEELGSRNGILVDGQRISGRTFLHHGQVVVCGPVVLMVSIDETQPHPRQAEGAQDPTTRRTVAHSDTDAMLDAVSLSPGQPGSGGRGIDPGILAAISSSSVAVAGPADSARQSAMQPAPAPGSITSPLEALRTGDTPPRPQQRRAPSTTNLDAPMLAANRSGALEPPTPAQPAAWPRLLAGVYDGTLAAVMLGIGLMVAILVLAWALTLAGAGVVDGLPRLAPPSPAGFIGILLSFLHPSGLQTGIGLSQGAAGGNPAAMVVLMVGAGLAAMATAGGLLAMLVLPTVLRGAPWGHRRFGLIIIGPDRSLPSYGRSLARWLLVALLWPLAIPAIMLRRRALHDVLSGCSLRRLL